MPLADAHISAPDLEEGGKEASLAVGVRRDGEDGPGRAEVRRAWEEGVRLAIDGSSTSGYSMSKRHSSIRLSYLMTPLTGISIVLRHDFVESSQRAMPSHEQ